MPRRNIRMRGRISENLVFQLNESGPGLTQAGNQIEQRSFAGPGWSKDSRDLLADFHVNLQREFREWQENVFEQQIHFASLRRRINNSLLHTARKARITDIPSSR